MQEAQAENIQPKKKILIIEDDTMTRMALCRILDKLNFQTFGACNGYMGLKLFKQMHPDVIITDILMPDKEGLSTIAEMIVADPKAVIIAMSGGGATRNMGFLEIAKKIGAARTITKPFTPRQILELMDDIQLARA